MITVPPGTDKGARSGSRDRELSRPGEAPGDLIVTFQVQPDRFFNGKDSTSSARYRSTSPRPPRQPARVRTIDGKKVVLKIPPGTQPGRKFRIKGLGVEKTAAAAISW